jgi:thymidylate synthase (FAD)|tara:strand:- start:8529 stop:9197 length:669 start_codon:yes stop_codon:yes gene_type:complete
MYAKLISYSQAPDDGFIGLNTPEDLVAYCARVSNPNAQINAETAPKLLNYLAKHKHWSPFEMVSACIEVETTRDIARQLLRHRSFSFQEFSQRYADVRDLGDQMVVRKARLQDTKNRQNSIVTDDMKLHATWEIHQRKVWQSAMAAYNWAIENGIAKEQARAVMPEGNTPSRLYVNGTLRSWLHYIELRSANGTQLEHIELAIAVADAIAKIFPSVDNFIEK